VSRKEAESINISCTGTSEGQQAAIVGSGQLNLLAFAEEGHRWLNRSTGVVCFGGSTNLVPWNYDYENNPGDNAYNKIPTFSFLYTCYINCSKVFEKFSDRCAVNRCEDL